MENSEVFKQVLSKIITNLKITNEDEKTKLKNALITCIEGDKKFDSNRKKEGTMTTIDNGSLDIIEINGRQINLQLEYAKALSDKILLDKIKKAEKTFIGKKYTCDDRQLLLFSSIKNCAHLFAIPTEKDLIGILDEYIESINKKRNLSNGAKNILNLYNSNKKLYEYKNDNYYFSCNKKFEKIEFAINNFIKRTASISKPNDLEKEITILLNETKKINISTLDIYQKEIYSSLLSFITELIESQYKNIAFNTNKIINLINSFLNKKDNINEVLRKIFITSIKNGKIKNLKISDEDFYKYINEVPIDSIYEFKENVYIKQYIFKNAFLDKIKNNKKPNISLFEDFLSQNTDIKDYLISINTTSYSKQLATYNKNFKDCFSNLKKIRKKQDINIEFFSNFDEMINYLLCSHTIKNYIKSQDETFIKDDDTIDFIDYFEVTEIDNIVSLLDILSEANDPKIRQISELINNNEVLIDNNKSKILFENLKEAIILKQKKENKLPDIDTNEKIIDYDLIKRKDFLTNHFLFDMFKYRYQNNISDTATAESIIQLYDTIKNNYSYSVNKNEIKEIADALKDVNDEINNNRAILNNIYINIYSNKSIIDDWNNLNISRTAKLVAYKTIVGQLIANNINNTSSNEYINRLNPEENITTEELYQQQLDLNLEISLAKFFANYSKIKERNSKLFSDNLRIDYMLLFEYLLKQPEFIDFISTNNKIPNFAKMVGKLDAIEPLYLLKPASGVLIEIKQSDECTLKKILHINNTKIKTEFMKGNSKYEGDYLIISSLKEELEQRKICETQIVDSVSIRSLLAMKMIKKAVYNNRMKLEELIKEKIEEEDKITTEEHAKIA